MQITVRNDSVIVEGYVNAIERNSKTLRDRAGEFIERICKGAFKRALERNDNVRLLLNHNEYRDLGGTADGNLELHEDNIGLHARAEITDPDVIKKAKQGDLVGWSFGFTDREVDRHHDNGVLVRDVKDMNLFEVSLLDRSKTPAYEGTLVCVRSNDEVLYTGEPFIEDFEVREETPEVETVDEVVPEVEEIQPKQHENVDEIIDYSLAESLITEIKEAIVNAD